MKLTSKVKLSASQSRPLLFVFLYTLLCLLKWDNLCRQIKDVLCLKSLHGEIKMLGLGL